MAASHSSSRVGADGATGDVVGEVVDKAGGGTSGAGRPSLWLEEEEEIEEGKFSPASSFSGEGGGARGGGGGGGNGSAPISSSI